MKFDHSKKLLCVIAKLNNVNKLKKSLVELTPDIFVICNIIRFSCVTSLLNLPFDVRACGRRDSGQRDQLSPSSACPPAMENNDKLDRFSIPNK